MSEDGLRAVVLLGLTALVLLLTIGPIWIEYQSQTRYDSLPEYVANRQVLRLEEEYPTWSAHDIQRVNDHEVWLGMNQAQALESWGKPDHVSETVTISGVLEQWTYERYNYELDFLYFQSGILTSWED